MNDLYGVKKVRFFVAIGHRLTSTMHYGTFLKTKNKANSAVIANSSIIVIDLGIHTILCYNVG